MTCNFENVFLSNRLLFQISKINELIRSDYVYLLFLEHPLLPLGKNDYLCKTILIKNQLSSSIPVNLLVDSLHLTAVRTIFSGELTALKYLLPWGRLIK
jgi:hypothetical protein